MISILSTGGVKYETYCLAVRVFTSYIKNDPKVFKAFKASMVQLKGLKIEAQLELAKEHDRKILRKYKTAILDDNYLLLLKFCAYVMRHHGAFIAIETFTSEKEILRDIEKIERFVHYDELDQIAQGLDGQVMNFNDYREVTSAGFREILELNEKTKAELGSIARDQV